MIAREVGSAKERDFPKGKTIERGIERLEGRRLMRVNPKMACFNPFRDLNDL